MIQILLVEDEPVIARNIARALERTGAEVIHVASACAAHNALTKSGYDLVIADISLGDGDGLDVIGEAADILQDTPIIVMTGQDSVKNRASAECLPVAAFLSKPFALTRLVELVAGLLRTEPARQGDKAAPSVVMYSHDTIGLGHMRRNSAIARELVALVPGVSVLMLVGCPAGMVFEPHPGIDYVKLPSLSKLGRGVFQAVTMDVFTNLLEQALVECGDFLNVFHGSKMIRSGNCITGKPKSCFVVALAALFCARLTRYD